MELGVLSIIASISLGILLLIINKLWEPIAEHIGYPFGVRQRVKDLGDAAERLREIQEDLFRLDPQPSSERCKGWMQNVQDLRLMVDKIKTGHDGFGRLSYFSKCSFCKEVDKELKKANDLAGRGEDLLHEARGRPTAVRIILPQQPQQPQDRLWGMFSYKQKVHDFIQDRGAQSPLLGIWGMGGIGKTFLLKLVLDSPAAYAHFNHVLYIHAGRGCTIRQMQDAIATNMGLPLVPNKISQGVTICNHLKDRSFLLLIDDLWDYLDLEAVGIPPLGSVLVSLLDGVVHECQRKVVFTTRNLDVCGVMMCGDNTIQLECLSKVDAWNLFRDKVGNKIVDGTQIHLYAKKIADECNGLPLALCTIGRAMSMKTDPREWRYTLNLLKKAKIHGINNMDNGLFDRLKLSYDDMENNRKRCFLLCSLWPADENIPKEKLIRWWIGHGLLDASDPDAITSGHYTIYSLVRASMLDKGDTGLYSTENSHVKMHEMIRKMALWIVNGHGDQDRWLPLSFCRPALTEEKWCAVQKAWISPSDFTRWSNSVCCPQLTMLVTRHPILLQVILCFQEIEFLDLEGTRIDKFPLEICALAKLQFLNLSATAIDTLPMELQRLSNLKYLYIRDTGALQTIPKGLISRLTKLRVLDLFCSGCISNRVQYIPSLLEELATKNIDLLMLGISVRTRADIKKLAQLNRECTHALCMYHFEHESQRDITDLQLLSNLNTLQELAIMNSSVSKELVSEGDLCDEYGLLPGLDVLELINLPKLQKVTWKNAGLNIRVVIINNCTKLSHVTWVQYLRNLEELTIAYCPEMEQLIDNTGTPLAVVENQMKTSFGRLKKLYLEQLPQLSIISEQGFPFEDLLYIRVAQCEKLKVIRVHQRINKLKIKIHCSKDWWISLGQSQRMMNPHFVPTFCF